jgi:hypothetical protein
MHVRVDAPQDQDGFQQVLGHGKHQRDTERMDALIQAEGDSDEEDHPNRSCHCLKCKAKAKPTIIDNGNFFSSLPVEHSSDAEDDDFAKPSGLELGSETSSASSGDEIVEITNDEVHSMQLYYNC